MQQNRTQTIFFFTLLGAVLVLTFLIFQPYLGVLFLAITLSVVVRPIHDRLLKKFKGRQFFAALITTLIVFFVVLIPLAFFGQQVFSEARSVYNSISSGENGFVGNLLNNVRNPIKNIAPVVHVDIDDYIRQALEKIVQNLGNVFSSFLKLLFNFFLVLLAMFFFLRDGEKIRKAIIDMSPLSVNHDERIFNRMEAAIISIVRGSLTIAIVQGILTIVGFSIFQVPNPVLWGSLAIIASLVPNIGTALVNIPAILFLYFTGNTVAAIGLTIWAAVAVGTVDNFLGPILIRKGVIVHPFLIFLSVLGGLSLFGALGFFLGPITLALLYTLFEIRADLLNDKNV